MDELTVAPGSRKGPRVIEAGVNLSYRRAQQKGNMIAIDQKTFELGALPSGFLSFQYGVYNTWLDELLLFKFHFRRQYAILSVILQLQLLFHLIAQVTFPVTGKYGLVPVLAKLVHDVLVPQDVFNDRKGRLHNGQQVQVKEQICKN